MTHHNTTGGTPPWLTAASCTLTRADSPAGLTRLDGTSFTLGVPPPGGGRVLADVFRPPPGGAPPRVYPSIPTCLVRAQELNTSLQRGMLGFFVQSFSGFTPTKCNRAVCGGCRRPFVRLKKSGKPLVAHGFHRTFGVMVRARCSCSATGFGPRPPPLTSLTSLSRCAVPLRQPPHQEQDGVHLRRAAARRPRSALLGRAQGRRGRRG